VVEWNLQLAGVEKVPEVDFRKFAGNGQQATGDIILLPGAGRKEKQWPRFREMTSRLGKRALAVWGPGEEELARATGARVAPPTTLQELARLMRDAALVIGGDTGPLHLAAALGTPVIGLYGPTNPARNGPYGQLANVVESFATTKAMDSIGVDAVMRKVEEILG